MKILIIIVCWVIAAVGAFFSWNHETNHERILREYRERQIKEEHARNADLQSLSHLPCADWDKPVLWKQ